MNEIELQAVVKIKNRDNTAGHKWTMKIEELNVEHVLDSVGLVSFEIKEDTLGHVPNDFESTSQYVMICGKKMTWNPVELTLTVSDNQVPALYGWAGAAFDLKSEIVTSHKYKQLIVLEESINGIHTTSWKLKDAWVRAMDFGYLDDNPTQIKLQVVFDKAEFINHTWG